MHRPGFTLTETLITGALFGVVLVVTTMIVANERAHTRDAQRLSDMTRVASGFALLYAQKASYADAAAGCANVGDAASKCALTNILPGLDAVKDPGRFSYTVSKVPDRDNFGIRFRLERRYGNFAAGLHTLTKNGIQ